MLKVYTFRVAPVKEIGFNFFPYDLKLSQLCYLILKKTEDRNPDFQIPKY